MPSDEDVALWKTWDIWDGQQVYEDMNEYKVSICTTCMNRTEDLKKTLVCNMQDIKYPNVQFVLLNYGSKDDLDDYVRNDRYLRAQINNGRLVYAHTIEPRHYSMAHSRNVAYRVASGDIVTNVDADNWTYTEKAHDFAEKLNYLANQCPKKAVFAKGKRMMHGRVGFYRQEFIDLGGYDESFTGYGFDDHDLVRRAMAKGHKLMWFGGDYVDRIITPSAEKGKNMENPNWRQTEKINKEISNNNLADKKYEANAGTHWGAAELLLNFETEVRV